MIVLRSLLAASCIAVCVPFAAIAGGHYKVLHEFDGAGIDQPHGLLAGPNGTFYGTASGGGVGCDVHRSHGCGVVFKIAADGNESIVYAFRGGADGQYPSSGVIADAGGNLYGVTWSGGAAACEDSRGCGTVYKISPDGAKTTLHVFADYRGGAYPGGELIIDGAGNLYGTTSQGGLPTTQGHGTVYRLAPDGGYTVLWRFLDRKHGATKDDGTSPWGPLAMDGDGSLYGKTYGGGASAAGIAFKIAADGTYDVLHDFGAAGDGAHPTKGVVVDGEGNLYGVTFAGGANNKGAAFKLASDGFYGLLHSFAGGSDGALPEATPVLDGEGNLYGTTFNGGAVVCVDGCGTVYKLGADGTETILHAFRKAKGAFPNTPVTLTNTGDVFGTTGQGGSLRRGVVFRIHH